MHLRIGNVLSPLLLSVALLLPAAALAQERGERGGRGKRDKVVEVPGGIQAGLGTGTAVATDGELPGEKEFNECVKIPRGRKVKITLKKGSDLADLVAWISTMTCKRFIVADSLRAQKVTIISPTPVSAAEAYRAFLSALEVMGLTVSPAGRYLKVVQSNWAIQSPIPTYADDESRRLPNNDSVVTQLVNISNVDVNEILLVLNKLKSRSGDITAYKPSNTLIITDNAANVRRMLKLVEELDVSAEVGEKIWVVRLKYADPDEVNKILTQLFAQSGNTRTPPRRAPARKRAPAPKAQGAVAAVGPVSASKIVSDAASNSLIIVASAEAFRRIVSLIKKLDVEGEGVNQSIHVYYLENGDADDMATTLGSLTGGAGARGRNVRGRGRNPRAAGQAATLFEGDVKVSADKSTNSLVIVATNKDFMSLRRVIKKLDIPRRQVFVEASILEISLDKNRSLGFAYHGGGITGEGDSQSMIFGGVEHSDWNSLVVNPLGLMGLAVGVRGAQIDGSGELLGVGQDIPAFGVMFQALQNNSNVNILSSPHILTTDNEEAEITVGQNLPFQGSMMGGGFGGGLPGGAAGQAQNFASFFPGISVQRQDVALKLKITPHVNESDMVRLELEQEVSDIVSQNFNGLGPATSKRSAKTVVVVRDQQTVVIGGLMSNRINESVSKVPLLGDIPILGYLFKFSKKTKQKTNLLIVLTPYVIRDQTDLRRILKKKLEERREFIERFTSFEHRELTAEVDFRHKRGLLAEISKVATQAEREAKLLKEAEAETQQSFEPLEIPAGPPSSSSSDDSTGAPAYNPIEPNLEPAVHPANPEVRIHDNRAGRLEASEERR